MRANESAPIAVSTVGLSLARNSITRADSFIVLPESETGRLLSSKEDVDTIRAERKEAKKAVKDAANSQPLSAKLSWAAHAKHVLEEEKQKDVATRSLTSMPNGSRAEMDSRKIYEYVYNSTHPDGAAKARGFEALGHRIRPGGFKPPIPADVVKNGEALMTQLKEGATSNIAVMRDSEESYTVKHGIAYNVTIPVSGINGKERKTVDVVTGWIDKRQPDDTTRSVPELITVIPRGGNT